MKNTRLDHIYRIALGMLLYPMASSSFAQTAQAIQLGPFDLLPSLVIEHLEDDNLYQSSNGAVSTGITTIYPTIELIFDNGVSGFSLAYSLENATFSDRASENYTDERVDLTVGTLVADLHRFEATGSYIESHDRQSVDEDIVGGGSDGDDDTDSDVENISETELDTFEDVDYEVGYTLGADDSLFNLGLAVGEFERTYVSNRGATAAFDREESRFIASLLWNVSPGLSAGVSYFDTEIQYVSPDPTRDGDQKVTALDIVWDPLDTLNLEISVGETDRTTVQDGTNSSDYWNVSIEWDMLSYSTLTVYSSSFTDEAQAAGVSFSVREEVGVSWEHEWSERFDTEIAYVDSTISYETNGDPREDRSDELALRAAYQLRSWVNVAVFYQEIVRSSTSNEEEYDQKIYGISALFQL